MIPGTFGRTVLRLPLARGVAKGEKPSRAELTDYPKGENREGKEAWVLPPLPPVLRPLTIPLPPLGLWWTF